MVKERSSQMQLVYCDWNAICVGFAWALLLLFLKVDAPVIHEPMSKVVIWLKSYLLKITQAKKNFTKKSHAYTVSNSHLQVLILP